MQSLTEFSPEEVELVRLVQADVSAFISSLTNEAEQMGSAKGVLYITESMLIYWDASSNKGFQIDYPSISLHAISRDTTNFPQPCIYCQIDTTDNEEEDTIELRICPQDVSQLGVLFNALSECQALHPGPEDQNEAEMFSIENCEVDDDTGDDFEDDDFELDAAAEATLSRLDSLVVIGDVEAPPGAVTVNADDYDDAD